MPFDGTCFQRPSVPDTGLFPLWSRHGCRNWLETWFRWDGRVGDPSLADRDATVIQLLLDAKGLIEDPKNWTRGTYQSLRGRHCPIGALRAVAGRLRSPSPVWSAHQLLIKVARSHGFASVEAINDKSSHAAVLAAFDDAIGLAHSTALV
jgi:hypothetical protein